MIKALWLKFCNWRWARALRAVDKWERRWRAARDKVREFARDTRAGVNLRTARIPRRVQS